MMVPTRSATTSSVRLSVAARQRHEPRDRRDRPQNRLPGGSRRRENDGLPVHAHRDAPRQGRQRGGAHRSGHEDQPQQGWKDNRARELRHVPRGAQQHQSHEIRPTLQRRRSPFCPAARPPIGFRARGAALCRIVGSIRTIQNVTVTSGTDNGLAVVRVEHVRGEVHHLVGDAHEKAALYVAARPVDPGSAE